MTLDAGIRKYKEAATFIVAASNSLHKEHADFVCSGANDEVTIQQAIDALPASGGKVVLLDGLFTIQNSADPKQYTTLEGCGAGTVIKASDTFADTKLVICAADCRIYNITFDGNFAVIGGVAGGLELTDNCVVDNCIVKGVAAYSLNAYRAENCIITNNWVYDFGQYGISISGSVGVHSRNNVIANNTINVGTGADVGIKIRYTDLSTFANNQITIVDGTGIVLYHGDGPTRRNQIIGNTIIDTLETQTTTGILSSGDVTDISEGDVIAHNSISGCYYGIDVKTRDTLIEGSTIYNSRYAGIKLSIADNMSVIGNILLNDGIIVEANADGSLIQSNYVNGGCHYWRADGDGIFLWYATQDIQIKDNVCKDCRNHAVYITNSWGDSTNTLVKDNTFINSTAADINDEGINTLIYEQQSDLLMDVLAVSATHIRSNEALNAAIPITFTIDAQPDIPRTLSGHFDSHANITEYDIEITGIDAKGNTITEAKDETDLWDWETNNAFATITSIKMTARTGTGAGDTMDIGITDVLGLSNFIYATSDVYKIKKNNANATVAAAQVNTTYDTYDMAVIGLAATDDFTIWFKRNLNIII